MTNTDRFVGCILGLAIGDSIGWPVEFVRSIDDIKTMFGPEGIKEPPLPAIYTDDTQMTLALANALLDSKEDDLDKFMDALSIRFVEWFDSQSKAEERRAPGNTCLAACNGLKSGRHWSVSGIPESCGCGSAMRSAPIGLLFSDTATITEYAISSSKITHGHELALCGSATTALLVRYAMDDIPIGCWGNELLKIVSINDYFKDLIRTTIQVAAEQRPPSFVLSNECLGEGWTGHEAVASALYCCLMHQNSYKDAVLMASNTVGDSDSIACITGAIMGAKLGVESIPKDWIERIENKDMLIEIAKKLLEKSLKFQSVESLSGNSQILVTPV